MTRDLKCATVAMRVKQSVRDVLEAEVMRTGETISTVAGRWLEAQAQNPNAALAAKGDMGGALNEMKHIVSRLNVLVLDLRDAGLKVGLAVTEQADGPELEAKIDARFA